MKLDYKSAPSSKERMDIIWEEVTENSKPVLVASGSSSSSNHYVCVIGFRTSANKNSLKQEDFVVLDPALSGEKILCRYGVGSYGKDIDGSGYGLEYGLFPDDAKE